MWFQPFHSAATNAQTQSSASTNGTTMVEEIARRLHLSALKEESSDESTIISSQTSTLTRHQGQEVIQESLHNAITSIVVEEEPESPIADEETLEITVGITVAITLRVYFWE